MTRAYLVDTKSVAVGFDGFVVLLLGALQQSVDVPADVRLDVILQAALHVLLRLVVLPHAIQYQPFHRQRFYNQ